MDKHLIEYTNGDGDKLSISFAYDASLEDLERMFRVIMTFATWQPQQIDKVFSSSDKDEDF